MRNLILLLLFFTLFSCKENSQQNNEKFIPKLKVVKTIQKDVPIYSDYVGQTYGLFDIPIRARVEGFLEEIYFSEGSRVKKGDKLYLIDSQPYKAQLATQLSELAEAKTQLTKAKSDLARYKPLAEMNAVSQSDLDESQAKYDASLAAVRAAQAGVELAQIQLSYCLLESPVDGIIGKTEAKEGEFVGKNPNPVILNTVSKTDTILVRFFVSENEYLRLARTYKNRSEEVDNTDKKFLELVLSDGSIFEHKGSIDFVDRGINTSTGALMVQASFSNPDRLIKPGLYSKVRLPSTFENDAILIPQRCVSNIQGKNSVLKIIKNKVQYQEVELGPKLDSMVIIKSGLNNTDQVIYEGLQKVKSGDSISPILIPIKR